MPTTAADIHSFLAHQRIAFVGISRDPKDFSRMLFREMCDRGYDMVPVNPAATEVESSRCFAHVQDIEPPAEAALIMTASQQTENVVRDCLQVGIKDVWMHRGGGQGSVSDQAVKFCRENGMRLVEGYCPYMFLPSTSVVHRVHRFFMKILGSLPD